MTPSWYDVLGIEPTASPEEVRAAWKAAIVDLDPADRRFRTANQAAEVLLDPERRAAHDAELAAAAPVEPDPEPALEPGVAAETETETGTVVDGDPAVATTRGRRAVPSWLLAVVAVLAAGSVALAVWLASDLGTTEDAVEDAARTAQARAEQAIVPVLSFSYEQLEEDRATARSYLTPAYREEYDQLFDVISDNAPGTQTVVTGQVLDSALVRTDDDGTRVDVLVFLDRTTARKDYDEPRTSYDQVTVTMVEQDGDWLVDGLDTTPLD
ncbi:J domain-containing protein [Nocardioides abyssi]|uniref:DnaJ domain-containing protein n=1 Tax=Nocardioides abyssi TaxID=3058370 RepID=A0ABT8EP27_9ACTN|nr:DnaJ domain-containing protein [Nocardioides abyssi]MDN4159854.1 DnaJ domain-containing protein [Nocardioides abyssi]